MNLVIALPGQVLGEEVAPSNMIMIREMHIVVRTKKDLPLTYLLCIQSDGAKSVFWRKRFAFDSF